MFSVQPTANRRNSPSLRYCFAPTNSSLKRPELVTLFCSNAFGIIDFLTIYHFKKVKSIGIFIFYKNSAVSTDCAVLV